MDPAQPFKFRRIAFLGYSTAVPQEKLYKDAYETAKLVAQSGYTVVNGGGYGVMEASSRGAKSIGGHVIGVTFEPKGATVFEGRNPNTPMDQEISVSNYVKRTLKLLELGDIYIIFNGGTGTISEFGMAWGLARLYFGHHKPLVLFGAFWEEIILTFKKHMLMRPEEFLVYRIVASPKEVMDAINAFEGEVAKNDHVHYEVTPDEKAFTI